MQKMPVLKKLFWLEIFRILNKKNIQRRFKKFFDFHLEMRYIIFDIYQKKFWEVIFDADDGFDKVRYHGNN